MNWKKLGVKTNEELQEIVTGILQRNPLPEETVIGFNTVQERPSLWWVALIGVFWAFLIKSHILVLTNRRLILIRLGLLDNQPKSFAEYPRDNIQFIGFSHLLTTSKLILRLPDGKRRNYFFVRNRSWRTTAEIITASLSGRPVEEIRELGYRNKRKSIIKQLLTLVIVIVFLVWIYIIGSRQNP